MDEMSAELEAQYCPPLDPALFAAILYDFDLTKPEELENARSTLDSLKESAIIEEAAGFDASGTGGLENGHGDEQRPESCPDTSTSQSKETEWSGVSSQLSSLGLEDNLSDRNISVGDIAQLEELDQESKIQLLQDVFGAHVNRYSIEYTLKRHNDDWYASMEELLNRVYFHEANETDNSGILTAKGIDGFYDESTTPRGRKGKAKNKRFKNVSERRSSSLPGLATGGPVQHTNKWESATADIDFIASRIGISKTTVTSVYYEKGASVPGTIGALLQASTDESKRKDVDETTASAQVRELRYEFPTISPEYLITLVRVTHPSTTAAHGLASALTSKPSEQHGGIEIVPQYTQPDGINADSSWNNFSEKGTVPRTPRTATSQLSSTGIPATASRGTYDLLRAAAFSQARAARRKARSDHLMGGAAAHYSQVSREYAAMASTAGARAADDLAAFQSSSIQLDLHGIDVLNAVRIAQEKVEAWWDGLGESRVNGRVGAGDRQIGYRIVVGAGRHSEGGKGKLGPAVSKALREEGWKVESAGAVLVVKGPSKK